MYNVTCGRRCYDSICKQCQKRKSSEKGTFSLWKKTVAFVRMRAAQVNLVGECAQPEPCTKICTLEHLCFKCDNVKGRRHLDYHMMKRSCEPYEQHYIFKNIKANFSTQIYETIVKIYNYRMELDLRKEFVALHQLLPDRAHRGKINELTEEIENMLFGEQLPAPNFAVQNILFLVLYNIIKIDKEVRMERKRLKEEYNLDTARGNQREEERERALPPPRPDDLQVLQKWKSLNDIDEEEDVWLNRIILNSWRAKYLMDTSYYYMTDKGFDLTWVD
jgi:hypothetical protein